MITNFMVGLIASITSVFLTLLSQYLIGKYKQRGLAAILNFIDDEITFLYPPRTDDKMCSSSVILPRTATEDFLAMNNVISAFIKISWKGNYHFRNSNDFDVIDKHKDIIFICSPFSNAGTKEVLNLLSKKYKSGVPSFEYDEIKKQHYLRIQGARYDSTTYDVVNESLKNNTKPEEAEMVDYAFLLKAKNPWDDSKTIMVLAGIRGIGTWGAGECLKKGWKNIYTQLKIERKNNSTNLENFVAIIKVNFNKCDLVDFHIENIILLQ